MLRLAGALASTRTAGQSRGANHLDEPPSSIISWVTISPANRGSLPDPAARGNKPATSLEIELRGGLGEKSDFSCVRRGAPLIIGAALLVYRHRASGAAGSRSDLSVGGFVCRELGHLWKR